MIDADPQINLDQTAKDMLLASLLHTAAHTKFIGMQDYEIVRAKFEHSSDNGSMPAIIHEINKGLQLQKKKENLTEQDFRRVSSKVIRQIFSSEQINVKLAHYLNETGAL